jgi:hypothetical protein
MLCEQYPSLVFLGFAAAAHFNRVAREYGLPIIAISRGITFDNRIPAAILRARPAMVRSSH